MIRKLFAPARRRRLRHRPLGLSEADLDRALGGKSISEQLKGPVLTSLPSLALFERELKAMTVAERGEYLDRAEEIMKHRFDLMGSGPVQVGSPIEWTVDFKTGHRWSLRHISRSGWVLDDGPDIHTPWELSRCQHLPILAGAFRLTGDRRYLDEIGEQISSFIDGNPIEFGPNWVSTMDVAIRASNWLATICLLREVVEAEQWCRRTATAILDHGHFIKAHLEYGWRPNRWRRGNHYLSNVVGLQVVGTLFVGSEIGRKWVGWSSAELIREVAHQITEDGGTCEGSTCYQLLVTEMFIVGRGVIEASSPEVPRSELDTKIRKMLEFVRDSSPDGERIVQIGDTDNGRFMPLNDYGRRDPLNPHFLLQANGSRVDPKLSSSAYPRSGFWTMRSEDFFIPIRCGPVGLGHHSHCDQLSFQFYFRGVPVVVDPGSFVYSADWIARAEFRSTSSHSTLQIGGQEQNPFDSNTLVGLFSMDDLMKAKCLDWDVDGDQMIFKGSHQGYLRLAAPVNYERKIALDSSIGRLEIRDVIESAMVHDCRWAFPLHPEAEAMVDAEGCTIRCSGFEVSFEAPGCDISLNRGWYSPSYGVRKSNRVLRATRPSAARRDQQGFSFTVSGLSP
ncbi:MAG: alginate lyase family protein [Solirubrobacterales bacterium]